MRLLIVGLAVILLVAAVSAQGKKNRGGGKRGGGGGGRGGSRDDAVDDRMMMRPEACRITNTALDTRMERNCTNATLDCDGDALTLTDDDAADLTVTFCGEFNKTKFLVTFADSK